MWQNNTQSLLSPGIRFFQLSFGKIKTCWVMEWVTQVVSFFWQIPVSSLLSLIHFVKPVTRGHPVSVTVKMVFEGHFNIPSRKFPLFIGSLTWGRLETTFWGNAPWSQGVLSSECPLKTGFTVSQLLYSKATQHLILEGLPGISITAPIRRSTAWAFIRKNFPFVPTIEMSTLFSFQSKNQLNAQGAATENPGTCIVI